MEVVLIDYETPDDIVAIAIDEDVDVIGISFMSGGQVAVTQDVVRRSGARGRADLPVIVGGIIRPFDVEALRGSAFGDLPRRRALETLSPAFRELGVARLELERRATAIDASGATRIDGLRRDDSSDLARAISAVEDATRQRQTRSCAPSLASSAAVRCASASPDPRAPANRRS